MTELTRRSAGLLLVALIAACGGSAAVPASIPPSEAAARSGAPSPSPRVVDGAILWALDRGPELTPDQDRLRVYLFATDDLRGSVRLIAPDGSTAVEVGIMGSGIFSADSCMSRVSSRRTA